MYESWGPFTRHGNGDGSVDGVQRHRHLMGVEPNEKRCWRRWHVNGLVDNNVTHFWHGNGAMPPRVNGALLGTFVKLHNLAYAHECYLGDVQIDEQLTCK